MLQKVEFFERILKNEQICLLLKKKMLPVPFKVLHYIGNNSLEKKLSVLLLTKHAIENHLENCLLTKLWYLSRKKNRSILLINKTTIFNLSYSINLKVFINKLRQRI